MDTHLLAVIKMHFKILKKKEIQESKEKKMHLRTRKVHTKMFCMCVRVCVLMKSIQNIQLGSFFVYTDVGYNDG